MRSLKPVRLPSSRLVGKHTPASVARLASHSNSSLGWGARSRSQTQPWTLALMLSPVQATAQSDRGGETADLIAGTLFGVQTTRATARHNPVDLVRIVNRAAESASRTGDWRTRSRVYLARAIERRMLGDLEGSVSDHRLAIVEAERSGELERVIFAHMALASGLLLVGAWEEAREALNRGLGLNTEGLELYTFYLPLRAWLDGRHDDAIRELAANVEVSRQRRDLQGLTIGLNEQA